MANRRKERRASRLSVIISLVLHAVIVGTLAFIAAREGMLGKDLKKIAVTMVPKEKPPEKPKEKPAEPKPEAEAPKPEAARPVELPPPTKAVSTPEPAVANAAPAAAPAPAEVPSFDFEGGKAVETSSDPHMLYKGFVEYTLRSHWSRPDGVADDHYIAEVELNVDPDGRVLGSSWKKDSGDAAWDNSVRRAIADTASIGRPPPKGFPDKILVRFDVQPVTEIPFE